jgi:hypothetical protein
MDLTVRLVNPNAIPKMPAIKKRETIGSWDLCIPFILPSRCGNGRHYQHPSFEKEAV